MLKMLIYLWDRLREQNRQLMEMTATLTKSTADGNAVESSDENS